MEAHEKIIQSIEYQIQQLTQTIEGLQRQKEELENLSYEERLAAIIHNTLYKQGCHCGEYSKEPEIKESEPIAKLFMKLLMDTTDLTEANAYILSKMLISGLTG